MKFKKNNNNLDGGSDKKHYLLQDKANGGSLTLKTMKNNVQKDAEKFTNSIFLCHDANILKAEQKISLKTYSQNSQALELYKQNKIKSVN